MLRFNQVSNHNWLGWADRSAVVERGAWGFPGLGLPNGSEEPRFYRHCLDHINGRDRRSMDFSEIISVDLKLFPGSRDFEEIWQTMALFAKNDQPEKLLHFHSPIIADPSGKDIVSAQYIEHFLSLPWRGRVFIDYFNYTRRFPGDCVRSVKALLNIPNLGGLQYAQAMGYDQPHDLRVIKEPHRSPLVTPRGVVVKFLL